MPLGIAVAIVLLVSSGVGLDYAYHHYPLEFWMGASSVGFFLAGLGALRHRLSKPPERLMRDVVPPLPKAIQARPERAALPRVVHVESRVCENDPCLTLVGDDPWIARVEGQEGADHVFCSLECLEQWRDRRPAPSL